MRKLRALPQDRWAELITVVAAGGAQTDIATICRILGLEERGQEAEALAARANIHWIVSSLHDQSSQFMDMLQRALAQGKLCVVDVSQLRGSQAMILSGLILRQIFDHNQEQFTEADSRTIPTIAVIEEAQAVLKEGSTSAEPFIAWIKEGRKYDLGALLITQQPGSLPIEILSQGDNWFIFHLLSSADLLNVQKANAHFSQDLLSALLNEPIPGQGVYWSSVGGKAYPVSLRVLSFEKMFCALDPQYDRSAIDTFAATLRRHYREALAEAIGVASAAVETEESNVDALAVYKAHAIEALREDQALRRRFEGHEGCAWGALKKFLFDQLPDTLSDRDQLAFTLVPEALTAIYGPCGRGWHSYKHPERNTTYAKAGADA